MAARTHAPLDRLLGFLSAQQKSTLAVDLWSKYWRQPAEIGLWQAGENAGCEQAAVWLVLVLVFRVRDCQGDDNGFPGLVNEVRAVIHAPAGLLVQLYLTCCDQ
jgi:hypothetical protein